MQIYPVRATHRKQLVPERLAELARTHFGTAEVQGGEVQARYGALSRLGVRPEGKDLAVEVTMNPQVPEDVARETIRRYNLFLEEATGFSSKERAKRLRKSASAPDRAA